MICDGRAFNCRLGETSSSSCALCVCLPSIPSQDTLVTPICRLSTLARSPSQAEVTLHVVGTARRVKAPEMKIDLEQRMLTVVGTKLKVGCGGLT